MLPDQEAEGGVKGSDYLEVRCRCCRYRWTEHKIFFPPEAIRAEKHPEAECRLTKYGRVTFYDCDGEPVSRLRFEAASHARFGCTELDTIAGQ